MIVCSRAWDWVNSRYGSDMFNGANKKAFGPQIHLTSAMAGPMYDLQNWTSYADAILQCRTRVIVYELERFLFADNGDCGVDHSD